jgi:hypothetical protein
MTMILKTNEPTAINTYLQLKRNNIDTETFLERMKNIKIKKVYFLDTYGTYDREKNKIKVEKGEQEVNNLRHEFTHVAFSKPFIGTVLGRKNVTVYGFYIADGLDDFDTICLDEGNDEHVTKTFNKDSLIEYELSRSYVNLYFLMHLLSSSLGKRKIIDYYKDSRLDLLLDDIENEFGQQFMYKLLNCLDECAECDNNYDDYVRENLYEIYETIIEANKENEEFMNDFYDVKEFLDNKYGELLDNKYSELKVLKKYSRK